MRGTLDWEWRYALMRTNTALHILCGVIYNDWGAAGEREAALLEGSVAWANCRLQLDDGAVVNCRL